MKPPAHNHTNTRKIVDDTLKLVRYPVLARERMSGKLISSIESETRKHKDMEPTLKYNYTMRCSAGLVTAC